GAAVPAGTSEQALAALLASTPSPIRDSKGRGHPSPSLTGSPLLPAPSASANCQVRVRHASPEVVRLGHILNHTRSGPATHRSNRLTRERHCATRTYARTRHRVHAAPNTHSPNITQEPKNMLKRIYNSLVVPLSTLTVALSF